MTTDSKDLVARASQTHALQHAFLTTAVEQAADGIVITDLAGKIQYVNPSYSAMTGYSCDELIGHSPRILNSGRHSPAFFKELWITIGSGNIWQGEVTNRRKDGTFCDEEMRIAPVLGLNGEKVGYIAIKRDITERRRAQETQAFLAAIVENSDDAIVACTPDGIIRSWNKGAQGLFGYKPEEMIGKRATAFVPPDRKLRMELCIRRVASGETLLHYEGVCLCKDGRRINVSVTGSPITDRTGNVTAVVAAMRDISQSKRAENALFESEERFRIMADGCPVGI